MSSISGLSPVYMELDPKDSTKPKLYAKNQVNMKDLYSEKELNNIISNFDCLHTNLFNTPKKCEFDMVYLPDCQSVIINNRNMTNDTGEIDRNGQAVSVGSWHHKVLDGDFSDIVNDVKMRTEHFEQNGNKQIISQLDSMAEIGKSQVKSFEK